MSGPDIELVLAQLQKLTEASEALLGAVRVVPSKRWPCFECGRPSAEADLRVIRSIADTHHTTHGCWTCNTEKHIERLHAEVLESQMVLVASWTGAERGDVRRGKRGIELRPSAQSIAEAFARAEALGWEAVDQNVRQYIEHLPPEECPIVPDVFCGVATALNPAAGLCELPLRYSVGGRFCVKHGGGGPELRQWTVPARSETPLTVAWLIDVLKRTEACLERASHPYGARDVIDVLITEIENSGP